MKQKPPIKVIHELPPGARLVLPAKSVCMAVKLFGEQTLQRLAQMEAPRAKE